MTLKKTHFTCKICMGIFSILTSALYIHFFITAPLDPVELNLRFIVKISMISIICNIGIILLSLDMARKFKKFVTISFLPSVTLTPIIAGSYFIPASFIFIGLNLYLFIKLNLWKRYEDKTVIA